MAQQNHGSVCMRQQAMGNFGKVGGRPSLDFNVGDAGREDGSPFLFSQTQSLENCICLVSTLNWNVEPRCPFIDLLAYQIFAKSVVILEICFICCDGYELFKDLCGVNPESEIKRLYKKRDIIAAEGDFSCFGKMRRDRDFHPSATESRSDN